MIRRVLNIPRAVLKEARQIAELPALARELYGEDSTFWEELEAEMALWRDRP